MVFLFFRYSLIFFFSFVLTGCITNRRDSVTHAKEINNRTTLTDKKISYFLIDEIDTRRFMLEAGMLAMEQGTTDQIKQYGELMVRDQALMIKEITVIAACRKITLPETLSKTKSRKLESLKQKQGSAFDKKIIKHFITDHRSTLDQFETATSFKDRYVRVFAKRYLPMIQMHLGEIQRIEEEKAQDDKMEEVLTVVSSN